MLETSYRSPYFDEGGIRIYHGDYAEILPTLTRSIFDLILADPPYGDTALAWDKDPAVDWALYSKDALKPTAGMWCFASMKMIMRGLGAFVTDNGWVFSQDIVWVKHNGSNFRNDRFRRVHEHVLFFYRKEVKWDDIYKSVPKTYDAIAYRKNRKNPQHFARNPKHHESINDGTRIISSVIPVQSCNGVAEHPTQKPVELLRYLIEYACPPNGYVLDPTMGVGSTLVAAQQLNRYAVGIEREEKYCEIAARRIQNRENPRSKPNRHHQLLLLE